MTSQLYPELPLPADEGQVAEANIARLSEISDDWDPQQLDPESILTEAGATQIATAGAVAQFTARDAYAEVLGENILGIRRDPALPARARATIQIDVDTGYVIPAGTEFGLTQGGDLVVFVNETPITFPPGSTTQAGVSLTSIDVGEDANGAANPTRWSLARIASVSITTAADGGAEQEDPDAYLARIKRRSQRRMNFIPNTAAACAEVVIDDPSVERCAYFNRAVPSGPGDYPGHVLLVPIDAAGNDFDPTGTVATRLLALPEFDGDGRPVQLTVHIGRVVYVPVTPAVTIQKNPDYSDADVTAAIQAAVAARLDKANWDYDQRAPGLWRPTTKKITGYDIAVAAGALTDMVLRVTLATVNGGASVNLTGWPVALPQLSAPCAVTFA